MPEPIQSLTATTLLFALASLAGCGARSNTAVTPAPSMTVTAGLASKKSVPVEVVASGSIAPWQEISIGSELGGVRVAKVLVEVGNRVKAGQPLVLLDARTFEVEARQAEARVAQARAALDVARAAATRGESLIEQNLISSSDSEELRGNLGSTEAQLAAAVAERDAARLRVAFASLKAPEAGVISSRTVQPGQIVQLGTELLRLIVRGRLEWRAEISEADLVRIKPGARVEVSAPGGEAVAGKVRAVSPSLDEETRTALVYADIPESGPLRAGMFAQGRIILGELPAAVLPRDAVVFRDGYAYVFVIDAKSKVEQRRVVVGGTDAGVIEIRSGLEPDERVAVRGAGFLGDGDVVRVVEGS